MPEVDERLGHRLHESGWAADEHEWVLGRRDHAGLDAGMREPPRRARPTRAVPSGCRRGRARWPRTPRPPPARPRRTRPPACAPSRAAASASGRRPPRATARSPAAARHRSRRRRAGRDAYRRGRPTSDGGRHTKNAPSGPWISTSSPTRRSWTRNGDTSPSGTSATTSSTDVAGPGGRDRVGAGRLVPVRSREPHVEVLPGVVARPGGHVEDDPSRGGRLGRRPTSPCRCATRRAPEPGGSPRVGRSPVPLLQPRVAVEVVAGLLPEPGVVVGHHHQPAHPLRALPEVEVRHQQPGRAAVLRRRAARPRPRPRPRPGRRAARRAGRSSCSRRSCAP